jgi:glutamate/tyrosine decarboxylase-like PLP-dependent enzyme
MSFKIFGRRAFEEAITRGFELAEAAEAALRDLPDWQVVTPAQMGILTFRYAPAGVSEDDLNRLNRALIDTMIADGFAMLSTTILRGQTVLRMCTINPRATPADVEETIRRLDYAARTGAFQFGGSCT